MWVGTSMSLGWTGGVGGVAWRAMKSAAKPPPFYTAKDEAGFDFGTHFWTAMALLVALVAQLIYLPVGWEFDMNSPDFNPMVFLPVLLMVVIGWQLIKAGLCWRQRRKFGVATMELAGPRALVAGASCRGMVRTEKPLRATGDFEIVMRCVESYRFQEPGTVSRVDARIQQVVAWEQRLSVPFVGVDSSEGLAFEFELPQMGPLAKFIEPASGDGKPYFKMKAAINIPGIKPRVITHNRQPNSRGYVLQWRVPTTEGAFCASFPVPVQEEEG